MSVWSPVENEQARLGGTVQITAVNQLVVKPNRSMGFRELLFNVDLNPCIGL
jgi:hypothetical protein